MVETKTQPRKSPVRPLVDLHVPAGCTKAAVYGAYHKGYIGGTLRAGASIKIRPEAYEYHSLVGYGPTVPPFGSPGAAAYYARALCGDSGEAA